jgi:hypothetical protein
MTLSNCETIALSHHSQSLLLVTTVVKYSVRFLKNMTLSKCETIALSHHSQSLLLVTTVVKSSVRF